MTDSDSPKIKYLLINDSKYLPKICDLSNGIDIPLQADLKLKSKEIKKANLGIRVIIPNKFCGLLMNKSSALTKYNIKVTLGLIDYGYNGELQTVLENDSASDVIIKAGTAFCHLLVLPAEAPRLDNNWTEPKIKRGGFGSTGQNFAKINMHAKNKQSAKIKTPAVVKDKNNPNLSHTQLNLIKMAEDSQISATSFRVTMGSQSTTLKCFTIAILT